RGSITAVSPAEGIVIRATDSEGRVAVSPPFAIIPVDPKELVMDDIEMRWAAGVAFTSRMKPANPAGEWTASASGLPAWMSLDPATGIITGTAPSEGLHGPYSITATDEMGRS